MNDEEIQNPIQLRPDKPKRFLKKFAELLLMPEKSGIDGSVFCIRLGLPGSGKSLGLVEEDLLPHLIRGEEVWCNFWINWKGVWTIDKDHPQGYYRQNLHFFATDEFESLVPTLRNCVLIMDEIGQVMEPRAWEQESGNVRRFFQLHRHHHVDIYGTTQDISLVAKSAWIVVDEFILCEKLRKSWMSFFLDKILKRQTFKIAYQDMTYQELKKMSYGWEQYDSQGEIKLGGKPRKIRYESKKLEHKELNDNKVELRHLKCPKCASRQKNEMKDGYCPKHRSERLITINSGIYDSDYDLPIKEKQITFYPMIDCPAGYRKIPYKGALSERQAKHKAELENTKTN